MKINACVFQQSQHLAESELMFPNQDCPFCGSLKRKQIDILQENPEVFLLECDECMAVSASRLPTKEALDEYYRHYYSTPDFQSRVTFDNTIRFGHHLAHVFSKCLTPTSLKILDFGGGDGSHSVNIAKELIKSGFKKAHITVIDYNETHVEPDDRRVVIEKGGAIENLPLRTYDIVMASAVIEHIPQPRKLLFLLLNLLKKGGIFYARTSYVVPLMKFSQSLGLKWDFTFPGHIHDLGQGFWETFFGKTFAGRHFSIVLSRPTMVETSFRNHFWRTLCAYGLKAPWYVLGRRYTLVGGWEIFAEKNSEKDF